MKKHYKLFLNSLLILLLVVLTNMAHAQTPAGPSATAPVITTSTAPAGVAKVYCAGSTITLTGPVGYSTYQWYKVPSSGGSAVLVLTTTSSTTPYTETTGATAAAAGYYNYQLVVTNSNGCSSPSNSISVYVVPPLTVAITTSALAVCSGVSPTPVLTANPTPAVVAAGYVLNYQWTDNSGAPVGTNSTYTVPVTTTATVLTLNYGVTVTYALNASCSAAATQIITINPLPVPPTISAS